MFNSSFTPILLNNIKIVLVGTTHPGNIGAVARAMKTMTLTRLALVEPKIFPSAEATSRASGADDLLMRAEVCATLSEAIADCELIIGASARLRTISWPQLNPRECAEKVITAEPGRKTAIVFGRENSGLNNHELDLCHFLLRIPCNGNFSSLNLAAAVQIVCYELYTATCPEQPVPNSDHGLRLAASAEQMESFYQHLAEALVDIGFMHPDKSRTIMRRLRRIYNRILLDNKEIDILRGILRMSQGHKRKV
jgi:tRNA (cytidine32/uridine32-2'-O)-methyltransferase